MATLSGKGNHVALVLRQEVYTHVAVYDRTADQIWDHCWSAMDRPPMTLERLKALVRMYKNPNRADETEAYITGANTHLRGTGRPLKMDPPALAYTRTIIETNPTIRLEAMKNNLGLYYYDHAVEAPSTSTLSKMCGKNHLNLPRKVQTRYHHEADEQRQFDFYVKMSTWSPTSMCDIDAMTMNNAAFFERWGRAPSGEECIFLQVNIRGRSYSCYGAYTYAGFICWRIYDGNCGSLHVVDFLEAVTELLPDDTQYLFDNASNQTSEVVTAAITRLIPGRAHYAPPYSPRLKPIERGFANVKRFIRALEWTHQGETDPIGLIHDAFTYYSVQGPGSSAANEHWNTYEANHFGPV